MAERLCTSAWLSLGTLTSESRSRVARAPVSVTSTAVTRPIVDPR